MPAIRLTVTATELDKRMLLKKLNDNGHEDKLIGLKAMKFALSENEFDYRIVFETGQGAVQTRWGDINSSGSRVEVFDSKGTELFAFNRAGRWTDSGATNAAAKEIIKRLRKLELE
jgi:hypothetical protein